MKKLIFLFIFSVMSVVTFAQSVDVVDQDGDRLTVRRTYVATETYVRKSTTIDDKREYGNVGIGLRGGYGFRDCVDFGGSLFYNFGGKARGKFGLSAGFDYGTRQWWRYRDSNMSMKYWHGRAGLILGKYVGVGGVFGKFNDNSESYGDGGVYVTLYLPVYKYFGLNIDAKWTSKTFFTLGGGLIFTLPTKLN